MTPTPRPKGRHWLSVSLLDLAARLQDTTSDEPDFDVIVIGSGYGGSIAVHHLAGLERDGGPLSVAVLERGREYVEGEFPAETGDLPLHTRFTSPDATRASGMLDGLFDFRFSGDVSALVGSGLGGGSLINAGVMLRPRPEVFDARWPEALRNGELQPMFDECEQLLGAAPLDPLPQKFRALNALGSGDARAAPVTIATSSDDVFSACNYCGNCATGCNFGAKRSLDAQLLAEARRSNPGLEIFTGATVQRIAPGEGRRRWRVEVAHTASNLRKRYPEPLTVSARWVIVAAGTFGSTELLMRSRSDAFELSPMLGTRFSSNGDMLAVSYDHRTRSDALATGAGRRTPSTGAGPTITGYLDYREAKGILIEEMNVPWPIHGFFEEVFTTSSVLASLGQADLSTHVTGPLESDPYAVDPRAMAHTSVFALMGRDDCEGSGTLVMPDASPDTDGTLSVRWEGIGTQGLFERQMALLDTLADSSKEGGHVIRNPVWRPLPESMSWFAGNVESGPLFTVHPLGGCPMGESGEAGVVDDCGRVYRGATKEVWDGLVVLDGAIVPTSLGTNPALTISALALRAIRSLSIIWGLNSGNGWQPVPLGGRPRYREVVDLPWQPTEVDLHERLSGFVTGADGRRYVVEITLATQPFAVDLLTRGVDKRLEVKPESRLRIFDAEAWQQFHDGDPVASIERSLDELALASARVEGSLEVFPRAFSIGVLRTLRALGAWSLNRGLRDLWQAVFEEEGETKFLRRIREGIRLASHAGERRMINYRLRVTHVEREGVGLAANAIIEGEKLVTYGRAASPLRQLMEMKLTRFPGMAVQGAVLALDTAYLARIGIPLIRIVRQRDTPAAIEDLLRLLAYLLRMMFGIHSWVLRAPDSLTKAPQRRLPGRLPGVPVFEQYHVPHPAGCDHHHPALVTRYRKVGGAPVLLIHGYSASGTTFAHECLQPSAAAYLWEQGRDVWVVDLRTSPGLPTSTQPWTFETVADEDLPVVIEHIFGQTGMPVDIVAHCMGAAMFSMSLLCEDEDRFGLRPSMRQHIRRVVLTQVGPGVVFSPANIFRAYAMSFLKHFLTLSRFDFRIDSQNRLGEQLIDRLLHLVPYPDREFFIENPWQPWRRAEFVSIRHRMDLLYGRDFSLDNVTPAFLDNIDAMFGPLNLDTVSQAMLFTRWKNVTDKSGRNRYYLRDRIQAHWPYPTLSLHGRQNGLSSVETVARNNQVLSDAGVEYEYRVLDDYGHQDLWVSANSARDVFPEIIEFLERDDDAFDVRAGERELRPLVAAPPHLGPMLMSFPDDQHEVVVRLGTGPNVGRPHAVALVRATSLEGRVVAAGNDAFDLIDDFEYDDEGLVRLELVLREPLLILVLYDEHPALLDMTFGDAPVEFEVSTRTYREGDPARVSDAIDGALALPGALLETALLSLPVPRAEGVRIGFASCQFPAGLLDRTPALQAWNELDRQIDRGDGPDMLLLLGDQVYTDPTGGLFDPLRLADRYRIPYQRLLSADPVQRVLGRVPVFMMLDDHELENDWEPLASGEHRR